MKLEELVQNVCELPNPESARKVSCLVGALVGDAACLQLEWIYDQKKVLEIVSNCDDEPAFWKENHCPFFTLPNGHLSGYGDQALQTLSVMAENDGKLDNDKIVSHFITYFGSPDSPYQEALKKRKGGKFPIKGPWLHGALIGMIDRSNAGMNPPGGDDAREHDALVAFLPLIAQQGSSHDPESLENSFKILTQDPFSLEHHQAEAFLISQFIANAKDPIEATKEKFKDTEIFQEMIAVEEAKHSGGQARDLVKKFGMACPMPGSFQSSLVSILGSKSYAEAIRETILCGGDSCSRANLIGACLGAKFGLKGIPIEWMKKVNDIETIIEFSLKCFC